MPFETLVDMELEILVVNSKHEDGVRKRSVSLDSLFVRGRGIVF